MAEDLEDFDADEIEEEEFDEDLDDEDLDEESLEGGEDIEVADDDTFEADEPAEEEVDEEPAADAAARSRKRRDDDVDDDDDELNPDDVEADLDTILRDRIAAGEDEEEDEEEEVDTRAPADTPDGVVPKRANEFVCTGCFLLVNRAQFGSPSNPQCPVGQADCPSIAIVKGDAPAAAPAGKRKAVKATRKR